MSVGVFDRPRLAEPLPVAGLGVSVVILVLLRSQIPPSGLFLVGLALVAIGAVLAGTEGSWWRRLLLPIPGAIVVAVGLQADLEWWGRPLVVATIVIGGALVSDVDHRFRHLGAGPVLLAVSVTGIFLAIPETDRALVVVAVTVPAALLAWPRPLVCLGPSGAFVVTALVAWIVVVDGRTRTAAVIGALGTLGLFLVEPLGRRLANARNPPSSSPSVLVAMAGAHSVVVLVSARVAGLQADPATAAVIVAAVAGLATGATTWAWRHRADPGPH